LHLSNFVKTRMVQVFAKLIGGSDLRLAVSKF